MQLRNLGKWVIAASSLAIVVCASSGASSASTPTGSTRVVIAKYGFSLSLPTGWQRVQLTKAGVSKMVQRMNKVDPALGRQLSTQSEQASFRRMKLYAIGPLQGSGLPNINVIVDSSQGVPSGAAFLSQGQPAMASELQAAGFKHVTTSIVHLPLGSAIQAQYSLPSSPLEETELFISHGSHIYIVNFTPSSVAAQIENTWHWQ
jgi:hypothetical protein